MDWLSSLGWQTAYGPDIAPDTPGAERDDFTQVVLEERLRDALFNLNPGLPASALETGLRTLINPDGADPGNPEPGLPPRPHSRSDRPCPARRRNHERGTRGRR